VFIMAGTKRLTTKFIEEFDSGGKDVTNLG